MELGLMFFSSGEELSAGDRYRLVLESARFADVNGLSSVWVPERHFTRFGCLHPSPAVLLAGVARETRRVRLCAGSVVMPLHDPIRVAEDWAVVDNLSGGRVGISFASGWNPSDFAFFPERYANRQEEMFRGIDTVRQLWAGGSTRVRSGDGSQVEIRTFPSPVQPELPVWVTAASNPATFVRAGELGFNLLTHMVDHGAEELGKKMALYREARARAGHAPEAGRVTVMLHTFIGEDAARVKEQVRGPFSQYLRSNSHLLQAGAQARGRDIDVSRLTERDLDELVGFQFERIYGTRALFGTPESCMPVLESLHHIGVDETVCLIDFISNTDLALAGLPHVLRLKALAEQRLPARRAPEAPRPVSAPPAPEAAPAAAREQTLAAIQARAAEELSGGAFYSRLLSAGGEYGTTFQCVERMWRGDTEALGRIRLPAALEPQAGAYHAHPAFLDNCFVMLAATVLRPDLPEAERALGLPRGMRSFKLYGRLGRAAWSHAVRTSTAADVIEGDVRILDEEGRLLAEARGLRIQRSERMNTPGRAKEPGWRYRLAWQPEAARGTQGQTGGRWLVLGDAGALGARVREVLAARGEQCVLIPAGQAPEEGLRQVRAALAAPSPACRGVVFLGGVDARGASGAGEAVVAALELTQAILRAGLERRPRLWLVTRAGQSMKGEPVEAAQGALWGLGRVASAEHPELVPTLVDVDPALEPGEAATQLVDALLTADAESQVVLRGGARLVARLEREPARPAPERDFRCTAGASYLVTGGLGGLGLEVARWLVERGARHLLLLGRTPLPPRETWASVGAGERAAPAITLIRELESRGVQVQPLAADVADEESLRAALQGARAAGLPAVRGVIHAAGVLQDRALLQLEPRAVRDVFRPKVDGAWALERVLEGQPLDFFVLFSSVAAVLGSPGQANYAAANAFLDALASGRRARGLPALSVAWGPFSEVGMAARSERAARPWMESISPQRGWSLLGELLAEEATQAVVLGMDWVAFARAVPAASSSPLLGTLLRAEGATPGAGRATGAARKAILALPRERWLRGVEDFLHAQVAAVLRLAPDRVDRRHPLASLGFDSLMAIELRGRIELELGVSVPIVALLENPSIASLSPQLLAPMASASASAEPVEAAAELEEVSL